MADPDEFAEHRTYLDESTRDPAWQAVCPDCPWQSRWVHFDEFDETDDPAQSAADHAALLGQSHTAALTGVIE